MLLKESFIHYFNVANLFEDFYLDRPKSMQPKTQMELLEVSPLFIDEMATEANTFTCTRQPTLLLMLHAQCFVDLNLILGEQTERGLAEWRNTASRIHSSLEQRNRFADAPEPAAWPASNERRMERIMIEAKFWSTEEDLVTVIVQDYTGDFKTRCSLMQRNPIICGLLAFQLCLKHQQMGLLLANAEDIILFAALLYVACKHSGTPPGQAELQWPAMDKQLEIHEIGDLFYYERPSDISESYLSYEYVSEAPWRKPGHDPDCTAGGQGFEDYTLMVPVFRSKYFGTSKGVCIDANVIESLLSAMRAHQEVHEREEAALHAGSKARRRNLLRKERSHQDAKYSIPQLLAVLEAGLRSETESTLPCTCVACASYECSGQQLPASCR